MAKKKQAGKVSAKAVDKAVEKAVKKALTSKAVVNAIKKHITKNNKMVGKAIMERARLRFGPTKSSAKKSRKAGKKVTRCGPGPGH